MAFPVAAAAVVTVAPGAVVAAFVQVMVRVAIPVLVVVLVLARFAF